MTPEALIVIIVALAGNAAIVELEDVRVNGRQVVEDQKLIEEGDDGWPRVAP